MYYVPVQACSQAGFEGVRTNPPCSLANFIFNETAAVQGTIIQPCSGIVTDGIQAIMQLLLGVVTYTSPVESFAIGIKNFDRWKSSLITWSLRSEALERLIILRSAVIMTFIDTPLMNNWLEKFSAPLRAAIYFRTPVQKIVAVVYLTV